MHPTPTAGLADPPQMTPADAPEVSVVIANYNNARFIAAAVDSALAQDVRGLEVLVVDDGSTDGALDVLEAIVRRSEGRVRLVVQPQRGGPAAARNRGFAEARGRWIAVLDGDDLMEPGRLRRLIDRAEALGADMVADDLVLFYEDGAKAPHRHLGEGFDAYEQPIGPARFIAENDFYAKRPALGYLKPVWRADRLRAAGVSYRTELRIGEDYDFLLRLLKAGLKFQIVSLPGYRYRRHSSSISHRIGAAELEALLDADKDFAAALGPDDADIAEALRRRERSIRDALAYDAVIRALKARRPLPAARTLLGRPRIAPLLWEPVAVRIQRLKARLGAKAA